MLRALPLTALLLAGGALSTQAATAPAPLAVASASAETVPVLTTSEEWRRMAEAGSAYPLFAVERDRHSPAAQSFNNFTGGHSDSSSQSASVDGAGLPSPSGREAGSEGAIASANSAKLLPPNNTAILGAFPSAARIRFRSSTASNESRPS